MRLSHRSSEQGAALLTVLWLAAALAAIAFSVATTVRGEIDRTSTHADGLRTYYLATSGIERAILYVQWGQNQKLPDGTARYYESGKALLPFTFPSGNVQVEVIPETAKVDINTVEPEKFFRLLTLLGAPAEQAQVVTAAMKDWRTPSADLTPFDQVYLSTRPSFRARHASFEEIEEILLLRGMTPELYYGTYDRTPEGRLIARGGLRDCISVYGSKNQFDINAAEPAVLALIGVPPEAIDRIVQIRRRMPIRTPQQLADLAQMAGPAGGQLRIGGNSIYTLRATGRLRLPNGQMSDLRRSVAATVKFFPPQWDVRTQVLRWYDNVWMNQETVQ